MKSLRIAIISLLVTATLVWAFIQIDDTHDQTVGGIKTHVHPDIGQVDFASLSLADPADGEMQYCTDCQRNTEPCLGGGSGAMAIRRANIWECLPGGGVCPLETPTLVPTDTPQPTATPQATATPIPSRAGSVWIALAECQLTTASALVDLPVAAATPGAAVAACISGTNTQQGVLNYANSVNVAGQATYYLPLNNAAGNGGFNNGGTTTANIIWLSATNSGNVVWDLQTSCVAAGASNDPSWTSNSVTSAAQGTASRLQTATVTLSLGGCAAGDTLHLNLVRNAGSGSDTMAGTASALGIELNVARL
jgi:hypothetical protein